MDKNRLWIIGSVLLMAVVLSLGWFIGVAPQLAAVATADAQRAQVQTLNAQHQATLAQLKRDFAHLSVLKGQLADLSRSVPADSAMSAFVDEVNALAATTGVTVTGVSVADAKPYAPVAPPAASGGATPTGTPSPSPSSPAATPTPTPSPTAVAGMPPITSSELDSKNFSSLAITLDVAGSYDQVLSFVDGIQSGERLFLVSGITTEPGTGKGGTTAPNPTGAQKATISGLVYVVTPDGQTAGSTPNPTPTPSH